MLPGQPSQTALGAASYHRAAHQILEHGDIFTDPLATRILQGNDLKAATPPSEERPIRAEASAVYCGENALHRRPPRGFHQRWCSSDRRARRWTRHLRLQSVPAERRSRFPRSITPPLKPTKRQRLAEVGISIPRHLTYAPVDFERESLAEGLGGAGFDSAQLAFLHVARSCALHLTPEAVFSTLGFIARNSGGAQVVFDYSNPAHPSDERRGSCRQLVRTSRHVSPQLGNRFSVFRDRRPSRQARGHGSFRR